MRRARALFLLLFVCSLGSALPSMDSAVVAELKTSTNQPAVKLLRDHVDPNLYYAVMVRLQVAQDANAKPLFRMVQNLDGTGDVFLIAQLVPAKGVEEAFEKIIETQPQARIALVSVLSGKLKTALIQDNQIYRIIGESSEISNGYLNSHMPLYVRLTKEGLGQLSVAIQGAAGVLLAFSFEYSFKAIQRGQTLRFKVKPGRLREQLLAAPEFSKALGEQAGLSVEWGRREVRKALAVDFNPQKPILPLNPIDEEGYFPRAWGTLFEMFPKVLLGGGTDWLSYDSLRRIRDASLSNDEVQMDGPAANEIIVASSQAGGLLRGICQKYADLVYRDDGASSCDALIPADPVAPPVGPPPGITPPPTQPGDQTARPPFDPLLD